MLATEKEQGEMARVAGLAIDKARIDVDRLDKLRTAGGDFGPPVSQVERDLARIALQDAEAKQKAAVAHQQVAVADRKAIEEELTLYTLKAPIAGRLSLVSAKPGDTLAVGAVIAEVIDLDEIDVLCFVPAGTVAHLKVGQEARLSEAGEEGDKKENLGRVVFIGPGAQPETGTIAVKVRFPNRSLGLRANTLHSLRVLTESKKDCLSLPESAVMEDQDPPAVLVAEPGKNAKGEVEYKAKKYLAVLGLRDDKEHRVELLGLKDPETKKDVPLDPHMEFITEGGHGLEDGDLVKEEEHKEEEHKADEHKDDKPKDGK
jgi:multidrug efflux pump subunit AcrA (membrane-fusion protein)